MVSNVVKVQTSVSVNWSLLSLVLDYMSKVYHFDNLSYYMTDSFCVISLLDSDKIYLLYIEDICFYQQYYLHYARVSVNNKT